MPPSFLPSGLPPKTKGGTPCAARSAFGSQKELTLIFSKPSCDRSSRPSDARPSAGCSIRYNRDHIAHPGPRSVGHLGRDPDRPGSCCSRDLGRDRGPCLDLDPYRDLYLCHGRGMLHSVGPSVPMPKPNRR
jgi:hypothetical protein